MNSKRITVFYTVMPYQSWEGLRYQIAETVIQPGEALGKLRLKNDVLYKTPERAAEAAVHLAAIENSMSLIVQYVAPKVFQPSKIEMAVSAEHCELRKVYPYPLIIAVVCTPDMGIHSAVYRYEGAAFNWANRWFKYAPGSWGMVSGKLDDYWQFGDGSWIGMGH